MVIEAAVESASPGTTNAGAARLAGAPQSAASAEISWSDARLISECLDGNERAWSALIDKYKNLIYSVPIRWGFAQPDASDIFQSVIADLLSDLGGLRDVRALPAWLLRVASHKCLQRKREQQREIGSPDDLGIETGLQDIDTPEGLLLEATREQMLRQALCSALPRCRELIRLLFFDGPARPYAEVAEKLGIAVGSIGFIRRRCLERLRKFLLEGGFTGR